MSNPATEYLTLGQVAARLGQPPHRLGRLQRQGKLPDRGRVGIYHVFLESDLPAIQAACEEGTRKKAPSKE